MNFLTSPDFVSYLCGAGAFAVVVLIWTALIEHTPLPAERLKSVTQRRTELRAAQHKKLSRRAILQRISLMKQVVLWFKLAQGKRINDLRIRLARAGYRSRDTMFVFLFLKLLLLVGLPAGGAFFLFAIVHAAKLTAGIKLLIILFLAVTGWILPDIFIKNQSQKRAEILRKSIPDALDLLVICAEAGLSLDAGLDRVSKEIGPSAPELAEEIGLTSVELNFLPERAKALQGLAERVPLPGVVALVNTLIQTEKYGTPLAQALRVLSAEMREERTMRAEEKAAKLPATLTIPMIGFIFPALFVVLIGPAVIKVMGVVATMHQAGAGH